MTNTVIKLDHISHSYGDKPVLQDVNLEINQGTFMGLVGPNGGGKTTIIKIILGLTKPTARNVYILDQPISKYHDLNRIGIVYQKANTFNKGFPATVFEVVAMGLTDKIGYLKFMRKKHKQKVLEANDMVDMREYAYKNIGELSG